ncbi:MAG: enoyl-CoA hydratase/isomerase family protein [Alphaproteobacteria bacterium]|nr:enoyl-CoA hydratase/isomerase family protein [Alphaproteobacteria bacterium]MDP7055501.1 enoyl-CoA hydratase/isomerase family protein [Alphaproteobacteria bacterium]MDP7462622.1 enoyl-CoA hydratase/isomerase family protein [Alphaproteobacteria bacterium]HJM92397.1 enoyl-CoA hydratase/isomerase family protein [Alphaproteobacteria bacterium]
MDDILLEEISGHAAILTLNRPDKYNALSDELLRAIGDKMHELDSNGSVRGIILTGTDKFFSTGADLDSALRAQDLPSTHAMLAYFDYCNRAIERSRKPVIAAINGFCLTGGLEVALACDIRIAGSSSKFGVTSSKIGSVAGAGGTQRLPRTVGREWAKDMLFSADFIDADTALRIGLVSRVVAPEQVMATALARVDAYAQRAPLSVWYAKVAVNTGMEMDKEPALEFERHLTAGLFTTEDRSEGMSAFLEKREAEFKGR